jgi:hypothetical protein
MAQPGSKLDPLLKQVDDIRLFVDSEKIPIFLSPLSGHEGATASWDEALGGDWKKFLGAAKSMGAKSVYLNWERFQEAEFTDARTTIEAGFINNSGMDVKVKDIEKFRACIGLTAVIEIAFIVDGVGHWYEQVADWFKAFEELTEESESSDQDDDPDDAVDKVAVQKWASELANDPRFRTCKNYDQREYLLEQIAGDDLGDLPAYDVLSRAESIFQLEIKPMLDERLSEEARALRNNGMTVNGIAQKLGIPRDKVSGMLNE